MSLSTSMRLRCKIHGDVHLRQYNIGSAEWEYYACPHCHDSRAPVSADAVPVKPLVWEARNARESAAPWFGGHYITVKDFDGWRWMRTNGRELADVAKAPVGTEAEAKAAAQADFDARIRSQIGGA